MKTIKYSIAIIAFASMVACTSKQEKTVTEGEQEKGMELTVSQFKSAGIEFGKIEMKNLNSTIQVSGVLDVPPQNLLSVSALMGGFVKSTDLLQGMKVRKGQLLAVIQNPDFIQVQQDYLDNKSKLKYAEQEYKRQEELSKDNIASQKIFQQVSAEYNSLKAINSGLLEKLSILGIDPHVVENGTIKSTINIFSSVNGYVTVVNVNIGKYVNPQDVICEIVDTEHLHAELTVFEKDVTKLKVGQKVRFLLVNEGNKERTATIYLINHKISDDRTVRVHAHLDKEDPALLPNMYLKAFIEITDNDVAALPEDAVINSEGKSFIFSLIIKDKEGYHFKMIEVQKGVTQNNFTQIILPEGFDIAKESVVIKGAYSILSKLNNSEE